MGTLEHARLEEEIRHVLDTETRAEVLADLLFSQGGLFGRLAPTEQARRRLSGTPLFREAQSRLTELQQNERAEILRLLAERRDHGLAGAAAPVLLKSTAGRVFETISSRYVARAKDIARFSATRYSFEEWCNWEAFSACDAVEDWLVQPRPRYVDLGVAGSSEYADLLITNVRDGERVVVEIGLAHDGTRDRWLAKLDRDAAMLERIVLPRTATLHLILVTSFTRDIELSAQWERGLGRLSAGSQETDLVTRTVLPPHGQMVLRGWIRTATQVEPSVAAEAAA
jgi:hypothetical protein